LGYKYNLEPLVPEETSLALMLFSNCNDFMDELTRHGGNYDLWDKKKWEEFKTTRYTKWLSIFQDFLIKYENGRKYFFGQRITYVDFAIFTLLDGLIYDFE